MSDFKWSRFVGSRQIFIKLCVSYDDESRRRAISNDSDWTEGRLTIWIWGGVSVQHFVSVFLRKTINVSYPPLISFMLLHSLPSFEWLTLKNIFDMFGKLRDDSISVHHSQFGASRCINVAIMDWNKDKNIILWTNDPSIVVSVTSLYCIDL